MSTRYNVFLSHNSADKPVVEKLARRLVKEGIQPWLDTWNLIPGEPWQEAIEEALDSCATCAVFVGPSGTGPWQNEEMRAAIDRRVNDPERAFRVIPVLLPGTERGERSRLPDFLVRATWVEFRRSLDDEHACHRLVCGIRGIEPGPGPGQAVYEGECPYRGLQFFDVEHAPFFFGREALTEWLLDALRPPTRLRTDLSTGAGQGDNRFLVIIGPSGSGKSSLARAGLIAALKQGEIEGSSQWPIAVCRPGPDPLESLAVALSDATNVAQTPSALRDLIRDLRDDERMLHLTARLALREAPPERRLALLVDQFEEIFTLCDDDGLRQALINNLLYAARAVNGQTVVLLALRADFFGQCAKYPVLAAALSDSQVLMGPMTDGELRHAIEWPAQLAGCEFEPGLVDLLLRDVQDQPGGLPLLQHALLELWGGRQGRRLTHAAYRAIGGVEGALERRAEAVYNQFTEPAREICKRIFLRLTQPGEGTEDTKRRVSLQELSPAEGETETVEMVIRRLASAEARLITTESGEDLARERFVEVGHEVLVRGWSRLRKWIEEDREALHIHRRLTEAAKEWRDNYQEGSFLYRGARLVQAEEWAEAHTDDLNPLEHQFLKASLANRELEQAHAKEIKRQERIVALAEGLGGLGQFHSVDDLIDHVSRLVKDKFDYHVKIRLVENSIRPSNLISNLGRKITDSMVAIPLIVQDQAIGEFEAHSNVPEAMSEKDVSILEFLAGQTAIAIANAQSFEFVSRMRQDLEQVALEQLEGLGRAEEDQSPERKREVDVAKAQLSEHFSWIGQALEKWMQDRTEELAQTLEERTDEQNRLEMLYRISSELSPSLDLDRVLAESLNLINRAVGVSHGSIMLVHHGTGDLIYRAALGRSKPLPRGGKPTRYRWGVGLAGWVLETRDPVIVPDVTQDPHWIPSEKEPTPERKSAMAVPLIAGEDVLGVLLLFHPEVDYFTTDHLKLVSAAAVQLATAISNAELYHLITEQAERLGMMLRTQGAEAAKHQAIVESIADGVLVLDFNHHVMLMNPAAARILGLDAGAIEGQHLSEIVGRAELEVDQVLARQLYDKLMAGMEQLSTQESRQNGEPPNLAFRLKAKEKVVVANLSPAPLGRGELPSFVTVLRDISRETEVERLKNEFISVVSHELRTPISSIKGFTDLLLSERSEALSEQQRHFVGIIKENSNRVTVLVDDILDISRIETGRIKLRIEPFDLAKLINAVVDSFRGQMVKKSLELTLDLPPTLPPIRGDEDRVTQILENLINNACKYTREGDHVMVRTQVIGDLVQVDVSDTGIGIAEKDKQHVFERFYRTEQAETHAADGTGLGLSVVKMFVELLGGKVWVDSELNKGSTFSFTLPLAADTPVERPSGDRTASGH
jgi:PAS domain S-box-containing protein